MKVQKFKKGDIIVSRYTATLLLLHPTLLNFRLLHPKMSRRTATVLMLQSNKSAHSVAGTVRLRGIVMLCGVVIAVSVTMLHVVLVIASHHVVLRLWWLSSRCMT